MNGKALLLTILIFVVNNLWWAAAKWPRITVNESPLLWIFSGISTFILVFVLSSILGFFIHKNWDK